jgi:hypothetical protein
MKPCPSCRTELADDALTCPHCGGSYQPDGSFRTQWDVDMARMAAEREDKVSRAERFGKLGRPIPHLFLDSRSGCLLPMIVVAAIATLAIVLGLAVLA